MLVKSRLLTLTVQQGVTQITFEGIKDNSEEIGHDADKYTELIN